MDPGITAPTSSLSSPVSRPCQDRVKTRSRRDKPRDRGSSREGPMDAKPLTWTYSVEMMGLEPTTPCLQSRCSSQLSYIPGRGGITGDTCDAFESEPPVHQY